MLYKLKEGSNKLEAIAFESFSSVGKIEKDLENVISANLLDLFEDTPLMPIFQERNWQQEADIYALNKSGDLIIFELKREMAGVDAVQQILKYAQEAGQWTFNTLEKLFETFNSGTNIYEKKTLREAHQDSFNLDHELPDEEFNKKQKLFVIGSAADEHLMNAVQYWKNQGVNIDFIPYRLFLINGEVYFEFISLPFDRHKNPADIKGVLFDTNRSYDENSLWEMVEKKRISAYGDRKYEVEYLTNKDIVFYSHKWVGLVAAAEVIGPTKEDGEDEKYHKVKFLTPIPTKETIKTKFMPFRHVPEVTGKSFFWARTRKVPYLTRDEALNLVIELNKILE